MQRTAPSDFDYLHHLLYFSKPFTFNGHNPKPVHLPNNNLLYSFMLSHKGEKEKKEKILSHISARLEKSKWYFMSGGCWSRQEDKAMMLLVNKAITTFNSGFITSGS